MDEQMKSLKSLQSGESSSSQRHISQVTKVSRSKSKRVVSKEFLYPIFQNRGNWAIADLKIFLFFFNWNLRGFTVGHIFKLRVSWERKWPIMLAVMVSRNLAIIHFDRQIFTSFNNNNNINNNKSRVLN